MTIHSCRDLFITGSAAGLCTGALHTMHALSTFLQGVLGYTFHSRVGNLPPATGSSVTFNYYDWLGGASYNLVSQSTWPYRSASITIGMGAGRENWIRLPVDMVNLMSAAYPTNVNTASSAPWPNQPDPLTGRWLVIKSDDYPLANSGIFLITSVSLPDNALVIDYRSTSLPFEQTGSYVTASLWPLPPVGADGTVAAWAGNGSVSGYTTSGAATFPRMILTSPGPDAWQVRLCIENQVDRNDNSSIDAALTVTPGYSGSNGDFPTGSFRSRSRHLHAGQWFNVQVGVTTIGGTRSYIGMTPGFDAFRVGGARRQRMFMWGDDQTGTTFACIRNSTNVSDAFIVFGEAEAPEPVPHPVNKLFVIGSGHANSGIDWRAGCYSDSLSTGLAYSLDARRGPISCCVSPYVYISQASISSSIHHDAVAGDSPFLGGSELLPVDLVAGTWPQLNNNQPSSHAQILSIEPRRLGRFPIARLGRCRGTDATGSWYATTPNRDWFHVECGVYLPWGGIGSLP